MLGCVPEITKSIFVFARESINLPIARDTLTRWELLCRKKAYAACWRTLINFFIFISSVDSGLISGGQVPKNKCLGGRFYER
jgi:hypothetical protein